LQAIVAYLLMPLFTTVWRPRFRSAVMGALRRDLQREESARVSERLLRGAGADFENAGAPCSLCGVRRANALNKPCDHTFLCRECCEVRRRRVLVLSLSHACSLSRPVRGEGG